MRLSKPKKSITRDFSDGLPVAEIVSHYHPQLVELHNYANTTNLEAKKANWELLRRKVFKKINFFPSDELVQEVVECKHLAIEALLIALKQVLLGKNSLRSSNGPRKTSVDRRSAGKKSKEKTRNNSKEPQKNEHPHFKEIRRLKEAMKLMEVKVEELNAVVQKKNERIKTLEARLFQNGLKPK